MPGAKYPSSLLSSIRMYWTILLITKGKSNTLDPRNPKARSFGRFYSMRYGRAAETARVSRCSGLLVKAVGLRRPGRVNVGGVSGPVGFHTCGSGPLAPPTPPDLERLAPAQTLREASCPKKPARKPLA